MNTHLNAHRRLIEHELGHAITALIAGLRVKRVWAPPPESDFFDGPPENPDDPAGYVDFARGGDRRAKRLRCSAVRSPRANPRRLGRSSRARTTNESSRSSSARGTNSPTSRPSATQSRSSRAASSPACTWSRPSCSRIRRTNSTASSDHILGWKGHVEDEPPDPRELEAELVRRGIITELARAEQYERVDPVILGTGENGDHREKAYLARVRAESRDFMLALFDAADKQAPKPERKTAAPIQIATFEA